MQTSTQLGMALGQLASGLMGGFGDQRQKGALDAMRSNELSSQIALHDAQRQKLGAETDIDRRRLGLSDDNNLAKTALMALGITGDDAGNDYTDYLKNGQYTPKTVPLAFTNGGDNLPTPAYVDKFPEVSKTLASLRTALAIGDKNMDLPKVIQGIQRNNLTQNLTPENAPQVALTTAAMDGKDPTNITEAALVQQLANGGNYGQLAKALLAAKGKGIYDDFNGGVTNVLDGTQTINGIGKSQITENNARASQASAGAKENLAQAALAGIRGENIKAGKGDGSQAQLRDFAQIRDDIRSDYNAQFPLSPINGQRPKNAPDFNAFTKSWLKQYNIDENAFFRNTHPTQQPTAQQNSPAYQEYLDAYSRAAGRPDIQKKITDRARAAGIVK